MLIIWRADDAMSNPHDGSESRPARADSVRSILASNITDQILSAEYEVLSDGNRRLSEVKLRIVKLTSQAALKVTRSMLSWPSMRLIVLRIGGPGSGGALDW